MLTTRICIIIVLEICCLDNNSNNYKTSIAPISLKRIELSGAPSAGVGQNS